MKRASLTLLIAFVAVAACAQTAPKSRFFTTSDGVRIHYLEAGKGPAIVFIPGWQMPGWIREKQIAHFSAKYHVIAALILIVGNVVGKPLLLLFLRLLLGVEFSFQVAMRDAENLA